ncbi:integrase [Shewanella sp. OPT22]|nr:integrase [Shewanella sp. OPT22]
MALTDSKLRHIKSPYKGKSEIADRDGLTIRISPKALITFNYRFRWQGKQQRIKLGCYPNLKLAEARAKVAELRKPLEEGIDPRIHQSRLNESRLLGDIGRDFIEKYATKELSKTTNALYLSFYNKYIIPNANIDVEKFTYTSWIRFFDRIREDTSSTNSGCILKRVKTIIRWSKSRGEISGSHCLDIPVKAIGKHHAKRERVLEWNELCQLWQQIEASRASPKCKICVQLLILTGARNSEIRGAKRREFDLAEALWVLPKERSKTKRAIRRPLSPKAINLIKQLDFIYGENREFLIEGLSPKAPLTTHAVNRFVQRLNDRLKLEPFVPHDFRRTITTRLSENKVMPHVTEKMLGHELGGVMAIYNKHDWIDEQRKAYKLYDKLLSQHLLKQDERRTF